MLADNIRSLLTYDIVQNFKLAIMFVLHPYGCIQRVRIAVWLKGRQNGLGKKECFGVFRADNHLNHDRSALKNGGIKSDF